MENSIEFKSITKYFPGVKALDDISFSVKGGEVLALLGENGAGKSTLLKILNGDYQQTSGEYLVNGEQVHFNKLDRNKTVGEVVLEAKDVQSPYLRPCSFSVRAGEILGFSGLVGAGRTELVRAITGADPMTGGEVLLEGRLFICKAPADAIKAGVVMVPEDRKLQGILPSLSVGRNIAVGSLDVLNRSWDSPFCSDYSIKCLYR